LPTTSVGGSLDPRGQDGDGKARLFKCDFPDCGRDFADKKALGIHKGKARHYVDASSAPNLPAEPKPSCDSRASKGVTAMGVNTVPGAGKALLAPEGTTVLKLDFDGREALQTLFDRAWVMKAMGLHLLRVVCYKTRHGYHVYIHVSNQLDPHKVLIFQAILGTDYRHVLGAIRRLDEHAEKWNVLFTRKTGLDAIGDVIELSAEDLDASTTAKLNGLLLNGEENTFELCWAPAPAKEEK